MLSLELTHGTRNNICTVYIVGKKCVDRSGVTEFQISPLVSQRHLHLVTEYLGGMEQNQQICTHVHSPTKEEEQRAKINKSRYSIQNNL